MSPAKPGIDCGHRLKDVSCEIGSCYTEKSGYSNLNGRGAFRYVNSSWNISLGLRRPHYWGTFAENASLRILFDLDDDLFTECLCDFFYRR